MPFLFTILTIVLMIVALVDIIKRDDSDVRYLPKVAWIIIVILLPLIGILLWFTLGRVYPEDGPRIPRPMRAQAPTQAPPVYQAPPQRQDFRTTEQQLADLEREIEEDRLRAELARKRAERAERTAPEDA